MTDPNATITTVGVGVSVIVTTILGPILGEYALILGMGLLGVLVSLTHRDHPTASDALKSLFRGLTYSFVFTGISTWLVFKLIPGLSGVEVYVVMCAMAFLIGALGDNLLPIVKERISSWISNVGQKK